MPFKAVISFEDDTVLEREYELGHVSRYLKKIRQRVSPLPVKVLPITPWLIEMAFEDALVGPHKSRIKRIEVYRRE
jgi:hypothetical protein